MSAADPDCVFCKLVAGTLPCQRVFEDEHLLAFLDVAPLAAGHTVLIPKQHARRLHELQPPTVARLAGQLGPLGRRITAALAAEGYNVLQNNGTAAGQVVPHVHFHIIPRTTGDGLGYRWNARSASADELAAVAQRIRSVASRSG